MANDQIILRYLCIEAMLVSLAKSLPILEYVKNSLNCLREFLFKMVYNIFDTVFIIEIL